MRGKTIRVSADEYSMLKRAQDELVKKGINNLPPLKICPRCGVPMDSIGIEYNYHRCPQCGFKEQDLKISTTGTFALGALVGLGAAALLYLLTKKER